MGLTSRGIGRGSRSSGLGVEHTLLVAMRRYLAVVARLRMSEQPLNGTDVGAVLR